MSVGYQVKWYHWFMSIPSVGYGCWCFPPSDSLYNFPTKGITWFNLDWSLGCSENIWGAKCLASEWTTSSLQKYTEAFTPIYNCYRECNSSVVAKCKRTNSVFMACKHIYIYFRDLGPNCSWKDGYVFIHGLSRMPVNISSLIALWSRLHTISTGTQ